MTTPTTGGAGGADGEGPQGPVIRDRRRLDPQTGQVRETPAPPAADPAVAGVQDADVLEQAGLVEPDVSDPSLSEAAAQLAAERLADLQRLQAEYVNYRRRVERDRDVARDSATASVLEALLPVLDDIALARRHGDLDGGPFAAIADKLESVLGRFQLTAFGAAGEPFDPTVHEALMQSHSDDVQEPTVGQVLQPGYRLKDKVLRAARVEVTSPPQ